MQPRRSPYLLFRFFCELYLFQMPSVGILFQTNWKMFLVSILCLNNMPEFTVCQEKRGSSSVFRTVCGGLPAASPSQAESCGVSSLQDKPTFPFYRKPNHLNNKSVDAETGFLESDGCAQFSRVGGGFSVVPFKGGIEVPHGVTAVLTSMLFEVVERGHSLSGK